MSDQSFSSTGRSHARSDARRNLGRILAAADEVFSTDGPSTPTSRVAERAGVASGTVFRHFPTKAALLAAVFTRRLEKLADAAESATGGDAGDGAFGEFFERWCREFAEKQVFVDALTGSGFDITETGEYGGYLAVRQRLDTALGALLETAQRSGEVRGDISVGDLNDMIVAVSRTLAQRDTSSDALLRVVLDGLRPRLSDSGP